MGNNKPTVDKQKYNIAIRKALSIAFARQAESDINMFEIIRYNTAIPECQKLHYLQMAFEKIVKAQMYKSADELIHFHAVVEDNFPAIYRAYWAMTNPSTPIPAPLISNIEQICHKIDGLCPAKKNFKSLYPEEYGPNCEYPWVSSTETGQEVESPLNYPFILGVLFDNIEFSEVLDCLKFVIRHVIACS